MTFAAIDVTPAVLNGRADGQQGLTHSGNEKLRGLVAASGLPPAVALTIFNRGLAASAACPESQWKAFMAEPRSARFLPLSDDQLAHAIYQFARIGVHREAV